MTYSKSEYHDKVLESKFKLLKLAGCMLFDEVEKIFNDSFTEVLKYSYVKLYEIYQFLGPRFKFYTAQKMKFSIRYFFSKCDQIRSFLRIWSHLLKKSLMENFFFVQL